LLLAGQIMVGLAIAVTTFLLVMHLHEYALAEADHEQRRLSVILADQAERAFEAVELVQTALEHRLQHDGVRTPEAFRRYMSEALIHEELDGRERMLPQLDAITVIDADGNLINSSRPLLGPPVTVADRDYYKILKANRDRTTFISEPLQNRSNGKWTAYVARKVAGPDGELLGLILGSVRLRYFEELYHSVALGAESSIELHRQDGIVLARYPHIDVSKSPSVAATAPPRPYDEVSGNVVVFRQVSPLDGVERLIAHQSLVRYPLVVGVTNSVSAILAEWHEHAIYLVGSAVILEFVVAAVGLLTLRQLRGQRQLHEARAARVEAEAARSTAETKLAAANERSRADRQMRIQNVRVGAALSNISQALLMFGSTDSLVVVNGRVAEMFGVTAESIGVGMTFDTLHGLLVSKSNLTPADVETMYRSILRLKAAGKRESHLRELDDGRTLAVNFAPVENEGWLVTLEDTTERRRAEAKIVHMAQHDALTELPNRVLFHARLTEAMARSRRGEACAVLYLDLDHFKDVNDTLGHPVGDALLRAVTQLLLREVRETDTVARLGGDEFAIVQSSVDQPQDATALATRLIEMFRPPFEVAGHQVMIGTSIGIAVVPDDGADADEIMKNADLALYSAKADGRARYRFFETDMDALMQARRTLEIDLRKGLVAGEFELFYQPLMNIKSGSVIGFEALVRWFHPERGVVQPSDFIPLAEEIGLIVPLGQWALQQACQDAVTWPGDMKVAVNVSVVQFGAGTLVGDVAAALRQSGLDPARLELEITESVMLNDTDATLAILYRLRDLGVGIAMDDFGTGYSSLSYLRRFPFSKVKIDRSFIADLGKDGGSDAIVTAVTELCETLGMLTLAEGVETEEQLRQLRAGNCGEAQGFLFSTPRPASEVASMCRRLTRPAFAEAAG
jgi:diguanylate cyclase (GGDEF)-like protein